MPDTYIPGSLLSAINAAHPDKEEHTTPELPTEVAEAPRVKAYPDAGVRVLAQDEPAAVLFKEDRLEAENLQLRIILLIKTKERFIEKAALQLKEDFDDPLSTLRAQVTELQARLQAKYGIDFTAQQIEPGTGRIIPAK